VNLGIEFHTPEGFFPGITGEVTGHKIDPNSFLENEAVGRV
jgi:hypothetical protein